MSNMRKRISRWMLVPACLLASCDSDGRLERGLCAKQNRHLSDAAFVESAVRLAGDPWESRYPSPAAFVSANPDCCKLTRAPRREDWESGDADRTSDIAGMLWQLGWSEYVVEVQLIYPHPYSNDDMNVTYWLGACGDYLAKDSIRQKRKWRSKVTTFP